MPFIIHEMLPSRFNIVFPSENGDIFLYNTFTGSSGILIDSWKPFFLEKGQFPAGEHDVLKDCLDAGFIVPDEKTETALVEEWINNKSNSNNEIYLVILTSYSCNLMCSYCYESPLNKTGPMSMENAEKAVRWVGSRLENVPFDKLIVTFYGGEPLLNPSVLKYVARNLNIETRKRGVKFEFDLLTNGVNLKENLITELNFYGLDSVKVTLDGFGPFHDRKRPLKNGQGTFDIIISNLLKIKGKTKINIGGNYDLENIEGIPPLLDYLGDIGLADGISYVSFKPIMTLGNCEKACVLPLTGARENTVAGEVSPSYGGITRGNNISHSPYTSPWAPETMLYLHDEAIKRGFMYRNILELGPCEFYKTHAAAIDPEGTMYICGGFIGEKMGEIGRIQDEDTAPMAGIGRKAVLGAGLRTVLLEKCGDCVYLPLCGGGCRFSSSSCQKEYFDIVGRELIQRNILGEITPGKHNEISRRAVLQGIMQS